ncbi:MAG: phage head spike fiber domain-containing protein, partial [Ilumatobacteraceae bacterium]
MPSLDLRFADSKSLIDAISGLSLITYTRASSGTSVGSGRIVETAGTNVPRFDHNPITGECLGLLVEEQRANLLLHSRTLTNVAWVATNITPAKNETGADGVGNSASSITATAANGTILQTVTSASAARATSAYVKRITGTGVVEMTQNGGTTWTAITVTSSWSRVSIPSATVTNPSVGFRIATSGDAIAVDYVQCETGAFVTSAIETTTAAVTRN